jgi:hypothetical protein
MGEFSSKDYNISKRLDSCQPSNLKILEDTLLVILSESEESKGSPKKDIEIQKNKKPLLAKRFR